MYIMVKYFLQLEKYFESKYPNIDMVNTRFENRDVSMQNVIGTMNFAADGVWSFRKYILKDLGGYRSWRCAADAELLERAKAFNMQRYIIPESLYYRRLHSRQLTRNTDTDFNSELRLRYHSIIEADAVRYQNAMPDPLTPETGTIKDIIRYSH